MDQAVILAQKLFSNFGPIALTDIIDISIMAFLIYKLINLIRSSSSGKVAKGIVLLVVALWLSSVFHLYTVNFLLSRVLEFGVLALVILFQPELRKLLEQVGSSSLGTVFNSRQDVPDELENAITQTVEAYTSLSKSKTGALMVFERKNMLDDAIRTGTALDAVVNSELLKNVFWNKAPLHDGAVIIRRGRIVGAGCMLPMSGNVNLSRDLGSVHGPGSRRPTDRRRGGHRLRGDRIHLGGGGGNAQAAPDPGDPGAAASKRADAGAKEEDLSRFKLSALFRGKKEAKADGDNQKG